MCAIVYVNLHGEEYKNRQQCRLAIKNGRQAAKCETRTPITNRETKSVIMSRFVTVLATILALMAVSVYSKPASGESKSPECPVNEVFSLCGTLCEPTCENPNPNPLTCPSIQCSRFIASCRCQKGYLRNDSGNCVSPSDC